MDNNELVDADNIEQEETQNVTGMEVINIPLLHVDGTNNIALTRLLSQHGITLQAGPGISQLTNGQPLTLNVLDSSSQNDSITTSNLIDNTSQIVFATDNSENPVQSHDAFPIVGNQMLCVPNITQTLTFVPDYSSIADVAINNSNLPGTSFHGNLSLQYRLQSYELFEEKKIFSTVVALLSEDICVEMFTNHATYMHQLEKSDVFQLTKQEGSCTVAGELWALLLLQKRLQSLLRTGKRQSTGYTKPEYYNKWVQTEKPKTTESMVQTNYPIKKEGLVNCGTMCEILLPSVSVFGREIKQSGRYNTNATTFLSHSVDEDMDEEYTPRSNRRKRKVSKRTVVPSENILKHKGEKVKQCQRIVIVKDDVVTVKDMTTLPNENITTKSESIQRAETAISENVKVITDEIDKPTVNNFIKSEVANKLSAGEEFLAMTSASDYTPVTSEDSLENDMSSTSNLNPELSAEQNGGNGCYNNSSIPQVEDQIQAALRASQICFEEVPDFQEIKTKPSMKKKTKKDYEADTPYKFFCDKCSFKSKRQSHLIKHMKFHDTVRKMFYCKQCSYKTIRNGALRRHEMTHSANIMHCNQCKYVTDDFISLDRHMKLKHDLATSSKKKKTVYKCPKCDYSSQMPSRYAAHLRLHKDLNGSGNSDIMLALHQFEVKEEELQTYQCILCSYKSIRKEHLVRHINNVHTDHRPFLCDICGQSFKRKDALSQHKITHVDKPNRNYSFHCSVCKKSFRSKTHLNEHMAMHSNVRQFLCDKCGTSFKTRSCQQKHIKTIHQNPRSFMCNNCTKRFNTKFALLRHVRTHEKPQSNMVNSLHVSHVEPIASQIFQTLDSQPPTIVQDIIKADGEVFETTEDNLQQVLLKTSDQSESATAIMYLPTSLQPF